MSEKRLIELETRLAYQEDAVLALNNVVCQQQRQIDQLEATCRFLVERFNQLLAAADTPKVVDEKPPHY
jgi:SlyX protein